MTRVIRCDECQAEAVWESRPIRVERPRQPQVKDVRQDYELFDFCCWAHLANFAGARASAE